MDEVELRRPLRPVILGLAAIHAALALAQLGRAPRGFSWGPAFVEHELLTPLLALASVGAAVAAWRRWRAPAILCAAALAGFWIASSGAVLYVGNTTWSMLAALTLAFGVAGVAGLRAVRPRLTWLGVILGLALSAAHILSTRAGPPATRPARELDAAEDIPAGAAPDPLGDLAVEARVIGRRVELRTAASRIAIWPGMDFDAIADSGLWTLFDYRRDVLPPWSVRRADAVLILDARSDRMTSRVWIWAEKGQVHVRARTEVVRDIAAHLSVSFALQIAGPATVEGAPWTAGHGADAAEFVAFQGDRPTLLRARSDEKGPFSTLARLPAGDPHLSIGGWGVQVRGWAEQGARAESPTAGWGVSQAAIERVGDHYLWSLAATSIGRGFQTVRTGAGVYVLEAVLSPPPAE